MSEVYQFFNDEFYNAEDFTEFYRIFFTTGVLHANQVPLLTATINDDNNAVLSKGAAMIDGRLYRNTEPLVLEVKPLESNFDRVDRLVIRSNAEEKYIRAFIVEGFPSSSPVPPALTRNETVYEISLYQILQTSSGLTLIDERFNDDVCGLSTSLFSIPFDAINDNVAIFKDQWNTQFNDYLNSLDTLSDLVDVQQQLELLKRNQSEVAMQNYLDGKVGLGEKGFFFDTLSDTNKIDGTATTAIIDTEKQLIELPASALNGTVTWKTHPISFVADKVTHYHVRPVGQLLQVVEDTLGGSDTIKLKNIEVTLTEVI